MNELAREIHTWAVGQGFYADADMNSYAHKSVKLMLVVSEVTEVMEAIRDNDVHLEAEEVADVVIRILDYAAWRGFDIDQEVQVKMDVNYNRPYKHGRQF